MKSAGVCGPFMLVDSSHAIVMAVMVVTMTIVVMLCVITIVTMTIVLTLCVIPYSRCISRGPR